MALGRVAIHFAAVEQGRLLLRSGSGEDGGYSGGQAFHIERNWTLEVLLSLDHHGQRFCRACAEVEGIFGNQHSADVRNLRTYEHAVRKVVTGTVCRNVANLKNVLARIVEGYRRLRLN